MASGNQITCGPCMFDDVKKDAGRWCTNCAEGLCKDCENLHRKSKTSRNHQVITIEDYRKIENVSISQICEHHGENLEWFCKSHDEVLCVVCVPSKHKACSGVIPISVNSANARQSSALSDLEETIEGTLSNVKQCIRNRESATKDIEKQELAVKTMVLEARTKINNQLNKLQEKLLHEIRSTAHTCKSKYMKTLQMLESTEEMLTKLREQVNHMKQFSSDIQVFLGTRHVNKRVACEIESIKSEMSVTKDYELKVYIDSLIEKLSNKVEDFGKIIISESATNLDFRDPKIDQAQKGIDVATPRSISDMKLQITKTFEIKKKMDINILGCVSLPNGRFLMANYTNENNLIEYSGTGDHVRYIPVSDKPYRIAVVDLNRIVVTYGDACFVEIMNSNTFKVEKKIRFQHSCLGVFHGEGRLYVIHRSGIEVIDLSGKRLETLKIPSVHVSCIQTTRDKIFCADYDKNKVYCCNLNGEELWQFESDSIKFIYDLALDNYHNVYVVGSISNTLTVIQNDGKCSKTLLTKSDGLSMPQAVYYDKDNCTLMISNREGNVAVYKIV